MTDSSGDKSKPASNTTKPTHNTTNKIISNINWKNFMAGTLGGAVSTAVFHPLELIKVRWQVYEAASLNKFKLTTTKSTTSNNNKSNSNSQAVNAPVYRPKYKNLFDTISNVYKSENGIRGLYKGFGINTAASGSAWGLYFLIYNGLKNIHHEQNLLKETQSASKPNKSVPNLTLANYTFDATIAGITTIIITNPLFLIKTRMCLQYGLASSNQQNLNTVKYKNSFEAFKTLIRKDGFFGLYKGLVPGLFGTLNGTIQMVTYDMMKSWWLSRMTRNSSSQEPPKLDTFHFSTFSSLSKILAVVSTYPFQLVRARLQDQHQNYKNVLDVIRRTYKNEKFYGFYKGLIPCLIRVTPAASLTFIVYENVLIFLNKF